MRLSSLFLPTILALPLCLSAAFGENWPTYMHDNARSGVTTEQLTLPLAQAWVYESAQAPRPAWPAPANQDFWHKIRKLRAAVIYDRAFHAVVADGVVYFGSSANDKVYALDAATGEIKWTFFTEGPVRLAPTIADGKAYFGSDDGWLYCLNANDGSLLWKHRPETYERRIPGNGRVISMFPMRTGVLVDGGVAYYGSGIFSSQLTYYAALDAATGKVIWTKSSEEISPQGYLLAGSKSLYIPTGRTTPYVVNRDNGDVLGAFPGQGGAYAVLTGDTLLSGPGRAAGEITLSDLGTKEWLAGFDGLCMIVRDNMAYTVSEEKLAALDRVRYTELARERAKVQKPLDELARELRNFDDKESPEAKALQERMQPLAEDIERLNGLMAACYLWETPSKYPYALIVAGDMLFAGGDGEVAAFALADGKQLWTGKVDGKAYGLCVADGALCVSTDTGRIHGFRPGAQGQGQGRVVVDHGDSAAYPEARPDDVFSRAADAIVAEMWPEASVQAKRGYCVVLGTEEGRLPYEIANRTKMQVIAIEDDAKKAAVARDKLDRAGLYGARVSVINAPLDALPLGSLIANLVVSERTLLTGQLPTPASEALRVLRPCGGLLFVGQMGDGKKRATLKKADLKRWLGEGGIAHGETEHEGGVWAIHRRDALPGSGEWTQLYANASHTACSTDEVRGPMTIQWFGEPGPREMIDRHHRPMSSLYKDGRLFVPANDRVYTLDAYNGTLLWDKVVPNSRRIGALKNCGHMLVSDDSLYIVTEKDCWMLDVASGERKAVLGAPQDCPEGQRRDWGYLNEAGNLLIGSGQKVGASFSALDWETCGILEGDFREVMVSDYLFAVDRHSGDVKWKYANDVIMNNAITVMDGRVYFIESASPRAKSTTNGRMRISHFCASDLSFVALDAKKGKVVWRKPIELPFQHIMYLNGANGVLLATGTYNKDRVLQYGLFAFDAAKGRPMWNTSYEGLDVQGKGPAELSGSHGEQWQHPVLNDNTIYSKPYAYDLQTGEKKDYVFYRGGHGCGGLTGSAHFLYGRGSNPRMYPLEEKTTEGIRLTHTTRPGCWLNIIPAGGLVMVPESSSGCTCAYAVQTSIALVPKALAGIRQ